MLFLHCKKIPQYIHHTDFYYLYFLKILLLNADWKKSTFPYALRNIDFLKDGGITAVSKNKYNE